VSGHASRIHVIDDRRRNRVGIVAEVVFVVMAVLADVVGHNRSAIFQMDDVRDGGAAG